MAELVLLNVKQYVAGLDLSGSYNMHALTMEADAPDFTAYGDTTRVFKGGLIGAGSEHEGFWDDPVDSDLFAAIGAAARNVTLTPDGGEEGEVAWFFNEVGTKYEQGAKIGDAFAFKNSNQVTGTVAKGIVAATGAKVADANGTGFNLGAVAAGQKLRASLHVLALAGGPLTLDVTVQSDTSGFPSAATQITFPQFTAAGGALMTVDGPITDTWYRAVWNLGASTTSATFVIAIGIS